ncbi:MAG: hypothetical protein M3P33_02920 [bacterium]|nr:hypothetical protein [bacterium]
MLKYQNRGSMKELLSSRNIDVQTKNIIIKDSYVVESFENEQIQSDETGFIAVVTRLNHLGFGFDEEPDEMRSRLRRVDLLLLAETNGVYMGYATFQTMKTSSGLVAYQARALAPEYQNRNIGRVFTAMGMELTGADIFAAKAQSPISIYSTIASKVVEKMFPIDALFLEDLAMQESLKELVEIRGHGGQVDLDSGLHRKSYSMGRLGNYEVRPVSKNVEYVARRLEEIGVDPEKGDAVYYMGSVKNK